MQYSRTLFGMSRRIVRLAEPGEEPDNPRNAPGHTIAY